MTGLGSRQRNLLAALARPSLFLVVGDKVARSLSDRGLLAPHGNDSLYAITPAGLRCLADELDAGRIKQEPALRALRGEGGVDRE